MRLVSVRLKGKNARGISLTYGPQEAFMNTWQEIIKVYSMEEGNMVEIDAYRINFHEMPGSSYDFLPESQQKHVLCRERKGNRRRGRGPLWLVKPTPHHKIQPIRVAKGISGFKEWQLERGLDRNDLRLLSVKWRAYSWLCQWVHCCHCDLRSFFSLVWVLMPH